MKGCYWSKQFFLESESPTLNSRDILILEFLWHLIPVTFCIKVAKKFSQLSRQFLFASIASFNPFVPNTSFLYHLKSSENLRLQKGCIGNEWIKVFDVRKISCSVKNLSQIFSSYFILKAFFVLNTFKFYSWLLSHVEKVAWFER